MVELFSNEVRNYIGPAGFFAQFNYRHLDLFHSLTIFRPLKRDKQEEPRGRQVLLEP